MIASAVEEQNATTAEIARNADQAAQGSRDVSLNIGSVSKAAADAGATSGDILQAAVGLTKQGEALRAGADAFIARVRAAWPTAEARAAARAGGARRCGTPRHVPPHSRRFWTMITSAAGLEPKRAGIGKDRITSRHHVQ